MAYVNELLSKNDFLENFCQGALWKEKIQNVTNKTVLPLFFYFDDFEVGNALGSHSGDQKLGAVYVSLPFLPIKYKTQLENIFLFMLFKSNDRKKYGNDIFISIVKEINFLREFGITFNISDKLYFDIGLIVGDNLGLNSMLGFVESFSSTYFCRFCKTPKFLTNTQILENNTALRNKNNYQNDLTVNNASLTGIKENSIFNQIKDFHVTENYSVDIMHDMLEGVCIYDLSFLLKKLIFEFELFSVNTLNSIISTFDYGTHFISNKPPLINEAKLKKR